MEPDVVIGREQHRGGDPLPQPVAAVGDRAHDLAPVRRVVTTHDAQGRSAVLQDGPGPHVRDLPEFPTFRFTDLWVAREAPAPTTGDDDHAEGPVLQVPPAGGNIFR